MHLPTLAPTTVVLRRTAAATFVIAAALLAGCSGSVDFSIGGQSVEEAATELIEGDLADQIGLGELTASCPEVSDPEVGTEFACTATTADGTVIELDGVVDREDHIDIQTTNLVIADSIGQFEAAGVQVVNDTEGVTLDPSAMDCGDTSIVIPADGTVTCTLTDSTSGQLYDAVYTIADLQSGDFSLEWTPRS